MTGRRSVERDPARQAGLSHGDLAAVLEPARVLLRVPRALGGARGERAGGAALRRDARAGELRALRERGTVVLRGVRLADRLEHRALGLALLRRLLGGRLPV